MGRGFRLTLQLVVTVAAAAVVARATESARRAFEAPPDPPRHRAETRHPFGPEPAVPVIELEASGELDGEPTPTERLLARRHAWDGPTSGSARDAPGAARRYG